jgi:hypothetical protein
MWHSELACLRLDEKKGTQDYFNLATTLVAKIQGNSGTIKNHTFSNFLINSLPEAYKPHLLYYN